MINLDITPFHAKNPSTGQFVNVSAALGPQGEQGVSIVDATITNSHLILILSDSTTIDAGVISAYDDSALVARIEALEDTVGDISTVLATVVEV